MTEREYHELLWWRACVVQARRICQSRLTELESNGQLQERHEERVLAESIIRALSEAP